MGNTIEVTQCLEALLAKVREGVEPSVRELARAETLGIDTEVVLALLEVDEDDFDDLEDLL